MTDSQEQIVETLPVEIKRKPGRPRKAPVDIIKEAQDMIDWKRYWKTGKVPSADLVFNSSAEKWRRFLLFLSQVQTVDVSDMLLKPYPLDWDYLRRFAAVLCNERMLVVKKVRQVLATITARALVLFEAMESPNYIAVVTSRRDQEAIEFAAGMTQIYDTLPDKWKIGRLHLRGTKHLWVLSNKSVVKSYPPGSAPAKSITAKRVVIDEAQDIPDCQGIMRAAKPTIALHGHIAYIGTLEYSGTQFYRMVQDAEAGLSSFRFHQINVGDRPDRDENWQKQMRVDMGDEAYLSQFGHTPISGTGVAFPTYSEATHVVDYLPSDFVPLSRGKDKATPVYMAIDPHIVKPTAVLWLAACPSAFYVIAELWLKITSEEGQIRRLAEKIRFIERDWRVVNRVIDPSSNTRSKLLEVDPVRAQLADSRVVGVENAVVCNSAKRSHRGLLEISEALQLQDNSKPRLFILRDCTKMRWDFSEFQEDAEDRVGSTKKFHFIACLKYIFNESPRHFVVETQEENPRPRNAYLEKLQQDFERNIQRTAHHSSRWIKV